MTMNAKFANACCLLALCAPAVYAQTPYALSTEIDIFSRTVLIPNTCELNTRYLVTENQISYRCNDYDETGQYKFVPGISLTIEANSAEHKLEYPEMMANLEREPNWKMALLREAQQDGYAHQYYKLSDLNNSLDMYIYSLCDDELCMTLLSAHETRIEEIVSSMFPENLYDERQ
jgi:hypothetical protein